MQSIMEGYKIDYFSRPNRFLQGEQVYQYFYQK
jgi:hypothetical protein